MAPLLVPRFVALPSGFVESWLFWVLLGVALLLGELVTGTVVLVALAIACLLPAAAAALGLGITIQAAAFGVATLLLVTRGRPLLESVIHPPARQIPTNVAALMGTQGQVYERVAGGQLPGRVVVGGEDWRAVSLDGQPIEPGARVVVVEVQGVTLTVARNPE